jgi:hypothetical protein
LRLELVRRHIEPYRERAVMAVLGGSVAQSVADVGRTISSQ